MEQITLRPATPADADAIAAVQVASWHATYRGMMPDAVLDAFTVAVRGPRWREILAAPTGDARTVVLAAEGRVRGFASTGASRDDDGAGAAELYAIYVDPASLRRGYGAMLLGAALGGVAAGGGRVVTLWVLEANAAARRFYEAQGFVADGARKVDAGLGDAAELRYRIALDAG
jgi:ribosomal protein S18 acetylase RimI-like enzyme